MGVSITNMSDSIDSYKYRDSTDYHDHDSKFTYYPITCVHYVLVCTCA